MSVYFFQEEINASKEDPDEESGGPQNDEGDEVASSASSVLGLAEEAPTRRVSSKRPVNATVSAKPTNVKPANKAVQNAAASPGKQPGQEENPDVSPEVGKANKALEPVRKALEPAKQIVPSTLWKGSLKDADVSSRLKKLADAAAQLEMVCESSSGPHAHVNVKGAPLLAEAAALLDNLPTVCDAIKVLRTNKKPIDGLLKNPEFAESFTAALQWDEMDPDTFASILLAVGNKAAEAMCPRLVWALRAQLYCLAKCSLAWPTGLFMCRCQSFKSKVTHCKGWYSGNGMNCRLLYVAEVPCCLAGGPPIYAEGHLCPS